MAVPTGHTRRDPIDHHAVGRRVGVGRKPSAAVASALSDELKSVADLDRLGVILPGGNVDLDHLPW